MRVLSSFDISATNVSIAKSFALRHDLSEMTHFTVGVAENLEYPPGSFDVIVGIDILHHVEIPIVVPSCLGMLKEGGVAIFREPVEVLVFDKLRNSKFASDCSQNGVLRAPLHRGRAEVTEADLAFIKGVCTRLFERRFRVFSRLAVLTKMGKETLEKFDRGCWKSCLIFAASVGRSFSRLARIGVSPMLGEAPAQTDLALHTLPV